jgi:hypothetical protein
MNAGITKSSFLELMRARREEWDSLLAQVDESEFELPGAAGEWSVRDIIVHVTAYERGLVEWLNAALAGQIKTFADLDQPDVDQRNAIIIEGNQGRSLEGIQQEAGDVFQRLTELVEEISEEDLLDAQRTEWFVKPRWGVQRELWQCIADDGYRHYEQHIPDIRSWIRKSG